MVQINKENSSAVNAIESLWREEFFMVGRKLGEVAIQITKKWDITLHLSGISKALTGASFLIRIGKCGSFQYKQKVSPVSKKLRSIEEELFSKELVHALGDAFKTEVQDLHLNFGKSGTCTVFLLRKILEKLIYITFARNSMLFKIEEKDKSSRLIGLEAMVETTAREKVDGIPFLQSHTAERIKGIKFLGDTSAHNPLVNVDMETIIPQMPYIITAYKELSKKL